MYSLSHHTFASFCRRHSKRIFAIALAGMLAVVVSLALPGFAAEQILALPQVTSFSSARFDVLITLKANGEQQVLYGQGETVMPDRIKMGVTSDNLDRIVYVVQVGDTYYTNDGSGWKESTEQRYTGMQPVSVAEQLALLQGKADGILNMGDTTVRGIPVTQYQVWASGKKLVSLVPDDALSNRQRDLIERTMYKFDLWIGKQDGVLYQQNLVISVPAQQVEGVEIPASELHTLLTFYDFNNPGISIQPPH